jgi:hypothetical protein
MGTHYLAQAFVASAPSHGDVVVALLVLAAIAFLAFIGWCAREVGTHAAEQEIGYYHEVARGQFARKRPQDAQRPELRPVTREQLVAAIRVKHESRFEPDHELVHDAPLEALIEASRARRHDQYRDRRIAALD